MEKLCRQMEDKLCLLLSYLTRLPEKLEMIADEIDNENLRNALFAAAIESTEYARELKAQLKVMEIIAPIPIISNPEEELLESSLLNAPKQKGSEILSVCESCETFFAQLYTGLLNEYFFGSSLKNMMKYQLLGLQSAFTRIKFLNSLRFNN